MTDQQALDLMIDDTYQEKEEATAKLQARAAVLMPVAHLLRRLEGLASSARQRPAAPGQRILASPVP